MSLSPLAPLPLGLTWLMVSLVRKKGCDTKATQYSIYIQKIKAAQIISKIEERWLVKKASKIQKNQISKIQKNHKIMKIQKNHKISKIQKNHEI